MNANWPVKKLGEAADILMGQSPPSSTYNFRNEGLPFFQGKAEFGDLYPAVDKYCSSPVRIANSGDILLSVRAPIGPINITKEKICIGRGLSAIRAKNRLADQWYLYYLLKQHESSWVGSTGSTFQAINKAIIENLEIPFPKISIQKKIVERLDAIRIAQELCDQQIQKTEELFESVSKKEITTVKNTKKLKEIVSFKTGKLNSNAAKPDGTYPFFTCAEESFRTNTYSFDTECVLLAGNNASGIFAIKYFEGKFDAYQRTYIIESLKKKKLNNKYLFFSLRLMLELFRKLSVGGNTKFLTLSVLNNIDLPLPLINKQEEIIEKLETIQEYKKLLQKQKTLLKELFDSVLDKSMKGEMDN